MASNPPIDPLQQMIQDDDWLNIARAITFAYVGTKMHDGSTFANLENSVIRAEQRADELLKSMSVTGDYAAVQE